MSNVEVFVRDTVISDQLSACIHKCINEITEVEDCSKIVFEVIEPENDSYHTNGASFCLPEISFSRVYCVFRVTRYSFLKLKKRKVLLFAITEPEVIFTENGVIGLSDIVVYVKNENFRKTVVPTAVVFAEYFNIKNIRVIHDSVEICEK